jgi:hypothetical protein
MNIIHRKRIVALGVAGAIAIGLAVSAGPVFAAPVSSNTTALTQVDVNKVVDVQWRRRGAGPWVAGAALGVIGAVVASQAYQNGYYGNGYYDNGYYDGYAYAPAYGYAPAYPYGTPYAAQGYYRGGYTPNSGPYGPCDSARC